MSKYKIMFSSPDLVTATIENIALVIWRGVADISMMDPTTEVIETVAARYPENCAYLCLVEETAAPADYEVRKAGKELIAKLGKTLTCIATVAEGSGVKQAATRLIMSTLVAFSENHNVFSKTNEAQVWLSTKLKSVPLTLGIEVERVRAVADASASEGS